LHPDENVMRYTASVLYATPVTAKGSFFFGALVWGMNHEGADKHNEHSILAEGTQQLAKQATYDQYKFVQKSTEELDLENKYRERSFDIHKLTLGTNRQLFGFGAFELLSGLQASVNAPPVSLRLYMEIRR
jgi:hypothetical protein